MITVIWEDDGIQILNDDVEIFWLLPDEAKLLTEKLEQLLYEHTEEYD